MYFGWGINFFDLTEQTGKTIVEHARSMGVDAEVLRPEAGYHVGLDRWMVEYLIKGLTVGLEESAASMQQDSRLEVEALVQRLRLWIEQAAEVSYD